MCCLSLVRSAILTLAFGYVRDLFRVSHGMARIPVRSVEREEVCFILPVVNTPVGLVEREGVCNTTPIPMKLGRCVKHK